MSRCVSDHTLWLVLEGEASAADRHHVLECAACSARRQRLEDDLATLRIALSGTPPPRVVLQSAPPAHRRWLPVVAAAAVAVVMVWGGVWLRGPSAPNAPLGGGQEAIWSFLAEASLALFGTADAEVADGEAMSELSPDLPASYATFDGEWPCDSGALLFGVNCETPSFLLLAGGR
jgi:hypothetical protein